MFVHAFLLSDYAKAYRTARAHGLTPSRAVMALIQAISMPLLRDWQVEMREQLGTWPLPLLTPGRRMAMLTAWVETPWEHHRFLWYPSWT